MQLSSTVSCPLPLSLAFHLFFCVCVLDAPRYTTVQITPREAVREGDSVTLTCSSDGAPPAESFAWFKEGESGSMPDSFKPELRLWSLDYRDHGEYFCVARNPLGTDRSRPLLLNVTCRLPLFLSIFNLFMHYWFVCMHFYCAY